MSAALIPLAIIAFVALLVLGWVAGLYNGLVRAKNSVDESWADIDTELRRVDIRRMLHRRRSPHVTQMLRRFLASVGNGSPPSRNPPE